MEILGWPLDGDTEECQSQTARLDRQQVLISAEVHI
jgi:hypothetical protein